jgi:hypothetical protein
MVSNKDLRLHKGKDKVVWSVKHGDMGPNDLKLLRVHICNNSIIVP